MSNKGKNIHSIRRATVCKPLKNRTKDATSIVLRSCLLSLFAGICLTAVLLVLLAFLLSHTPLSLGLVRPLACGAAACGAALSGVLLAKRIGRQMLLCGLLCGGFYAICQLMAAFLTSGEAAFDGTNLMLPVALLLGGVMGGALAALRTVR